jgi:hypothetical protein
MVWGMLCAWAQFSRAEQPSADVPSRKTVAIFADGRPRIYLDKAGSDWQKLAGVTSPLQSIGLPLEDLPRCFELLTGQALPTEAGEGRIPLRLKLLEGSKELGHQGYLIEVSDKEIVLAAPHPMGVFNAIYDVLDRWGCHWIMPGMEGEIINKTNLLDLPAGTITWNNSFDGRYEANVDNEFNLWRARNRMGWTEWNGVQHGFQIVYLPPDGNFKEHPDWYAQIAGHRVPVQLETANPQVVNQICHVADRLLKEPLRMAFPVEWDDNPQMSTSPESLALDPPNNPTFMGLPSMTDRTVILANAVAEHIEKNFPDKYVGFYAYTHHTLPPVAVKPHRNILLGLTRCGFSLIHYLPTQKDPTSIAWWKLLEDWRKLGVTIFSYEYDPLPWSAGMLTPVHLERPRMLRKLWEEGVKGSYTDRGGRNDAANFVTCYIEMRIKADPRREPEAELASLCRIFFGPAADAMNQYYLALDEVTRTNFPDHNFTNFGLFSFGDIYTPAIIAKARVQLQKAVTAAEGDPTISRRVEMVRCQFDYMEQFLLGWWAAKAKNKTGALEHFDHAMKLIDPLAAMNPKYIDAKAAHDQLYAARGNVMTQYFPEWINLQRQWSLLGPLPNRYAEMDFYEEMFPQAIFDGNVKPGQPARLKNGTPLQWRTYNSPEGMMDFSQAFGRHTSDQPVRAAYAGIRLDSPRAQSIMIRMDSFHPHRLYLNEKEIFHRGNWNSPCPDREVVKVDLPAGTSSLIFRSSQVSADDPSSRWGFWLRITDDKYEPIKDLRIGPLQ